MRRLVSASSGLLWKGLTAAGPISSPPFVLNSICRRHQVVVRPHTLVPLGLQPYLTISNVSIDGAGGSGEGEVAAILAMECGSIPASVAAAMLESHTQGNANLSTEAVEHLAASACHNNAATLFTCTSSELSRIVSAMPSHPSTPVAMLCNVLQQRSSELTADQLSCALCNLLQLSQLCISPHPHPSVEPAVSAMGICTSLAAKLLHSQSQQDLSIPALVELLTACFRTQHLLTGLDLHTAMERRWVELLEERDGASILDTVPADQFVQLLGIGARLHTPSGILQQVEASTRQQGVGLQLMPTTDTANFHTETRLECSERWQRIMQIMQQRVSSREFNIVELGELAKTLNKQARHLSMQSSSSSSSSRIDDESQVHHHSPPLATVIHAIKQQLPSAPLDQVAAAARSLGQAFMLGEAQLLQAFAQVFSDSKFLEKLSDNGLQLWLEAISRAVIDTRQSYDSPSEVLANRLLASAHAEWCTRASAQRSSPEQLVPLFWALARVRQLPQSDLRLLLSRCDSSNWASVGSVDAVQLVSACMKCQLWRDSASAGLIQRVQQLLPSMDARTLTKLVKILQKTGYGWTYLGKQVWHALQSAVTRGSNVDMLRLYNVAALFDKPQLQRLLAQHAMARLRRSLDVYSQHPLLLLLCAAAADGLIPKPDRQHAYKLVTAVLAELQDYQAASLAFYLPSFRQTDQPLADRIVASSLALLPSASLILLAHTLSGVHRLRGGGASEDYWTVVKHVVSSVAQGCSQQELFHISAWMLEDNALYSPELPDSVALAARNLDPSNISCKLAVQLAQLISQKVLAAEAAPVLLEALQHRESAYNVHQLTILLSMLCDEDVHVPEQCINHLLTLMRDLGDPKHLLQPLSLQVYNILSKQQLTSSLPPSDVQSHQISLNAVPDVTVVDTRPSSMPLWLHDMMRDPTIIMMETHSSQLCNVAQQWAQKFPHLDSLLYARLQLITAQQSQHASVSQVMFNHGCNNTDHPHLVALIAAASTKVQGNRKIFLL